MIKVGIVGATGYVGAELVRLLHSHPKAEVVAISSVSYEGKPISSVYPAYLNVCDMVCQNQETVVEKSDVVFAALPHGLSQELASECMKHNKIMIDIGADFRLESEEEYKEWYGGEFLDKELHKQAVYAMPELFRENIKGKKLISNPGCYTTAVPLAIAPMLKAGLISKEGIIADCKSGATGAGRGLAQNTHFCELNEGFNPYKVASHRHTPEIEQTLSKIANEKVNMTFVPHLLPINRGIIATVYAKLTTKVTKEQVEKIYSDFYKGEKFIRLVPNGQNVNLGNVTYSNYCDIATYIDDRTGTFIAVSAIDNMVKGAAGQAIQNMNIVFDLEEDCGLDIIPPAF